MLELSEQMYKELLARAVRGQPYEVCGVLARRDGGTLRHIPMRNVLESPTLYAFDPEEQRQAWDQMDSLHEEPHVIYHSHIGTDAAPSQTDIAYAWDVTLHYLIVSVRDDTMRSWRIIDGVATEERVRVTL